MFARVARGADESRPRMTIREPIRMEMPLKQNSRPHVRPEDLLYHEELGALMATIHLARYKRSKEYRYGAVSYLKLVDEARIPNPGGPEVERDLAVYREALRRRAPPLEVGGER
jgi:hypothetical protein